MINKRTFFTYITLAGILFGSTYITLTVLGITNLNWSKEFYSFGIIAILGGILLVIGKSFFDQLKLISLRAWRICLFAYFLFVVLLLAKIGDFLIIEKEGWLSLYKHPFVWLILATLTGQLVLFIYKRNKLQMG